MNKVERKKTDLHIQRMYDLLDVYREVAPDCWSQGEAWMRTVKHKAPRYYITPERARNIISLMINGDMSVLDRMRPNKKRMYLSLYETMERLLQKRAYSNKPLIFVLSFAVIQPAPEFFITPDYMRIMFFFHKLEMKKEKERIKELAGEINDDPTIENDEPESDGDGQDC